MSHTTAVRNILITDIVALESAIDKLKSEGIKCDLLENAIPRGYSRNQTGMDKAAPFVIKLEDSPYDVGLYPVEDAEGLEARTDFYSGHVERLLGNPINDGAPANQRKLGKFYQAYTVASTINSAIREGYSVDQQVGENGETRLVLTA